MKKNKNILIIVLCCLIVLLLALAGWFFRLIKNDKIGGKGISIDANQFPDAIFREYVQGFDENGNGYLSDNEIMSVSVINVSDSAVQSLKGIENFTNLTKLICSNNNVDQIDASNNKNLILLNCASNKISRLELNSNDKLQYLDCSNNQISSLSLENCSELLVVDAAENELSGLEVGNCAKLKQINLKKNKLRNLSLDNNTCLEVLNLTHNELKELKLDYCKKLRETLVDFDTVTGLTGVTDGTGLRSCVDVSYAKEGTEYIVNIGDLSGWETSIADNKVYYVINGERADTVVDQNLIRIPQTATDIYCNYQNENQAGATKTSINFSGDIDFSKTEIVKITSSEESIEKETENVPEKEPEKTIEKIPEIELSYRTHLQGVGWTEYASNGAMSGKTGESRRLEGVEIRITNAPFKGTLEYSSHVQSVGWMEWVKDGATSGVLGESKRLEALRMRLTEDMAGKYSVYYRVHAQGTGWLGWAKDGEDAGTTGYGYRLEAIQVVVLPKENPAPGLEYNGVSGAEGIKAFMDAAKEEQTTE